MPHKCSLWPKRVLKGLKWYNSSETGIHSAPHTADVDIYFKSMINIMSAFPCAENWKLSAQGIGLIKIDLLFSLSFSFLKHKSYCWIT